MSKNLIILGLVIIVIAETAYIVMKKGIPSNTVVVKSLNTLGNPERRPSGGSRPIPVVKGMKLMDTPLAKNVYKIVPGPLSDDAKKAMTGFDVTVSTAASDGTVIVQLSPKDSDDQQQQYTVKKGYSLYFVEMTKGDDNADADKDMNYRDDYGIIVDSNGIIQ